MYAVIKTGGKQYKVAPGEKLKVEQIPADIGSEIVLDQVLLVSSGEDGSAGVSCLKTTRKNRFFSEALTRGMTSTLISCSVPECLS